MKIFVRIFNARSSFRIISKLRLRLRDNGIVGVSSFLFTLLGTDFKF